MLFDTEGFPKDTKAVATAGCFISVAKLIFQSCGKIEFLPILPVHKKVGFGPVDMGRWCHLRLAEVLHHPQLVSMTEPRSAKQLDKGTISLNLGQQVSAVLVDEAVKWNRSDAEVMSTAIAHHSIGQAARPKGQAAYHHQIS